MFLIIKHYIDKSLLLTEAVLIDPQKQQYFKIFLKLKWTFLFQMSFIPVDKAAFSASLLQSSESHDLQEWSFHSEM